MERSTLKALPAERFQAPDWKQVSAHAGDQFLTFNKRRFSLPPPGGDSGCGPDTRPRCYSSTTTSTSFVSTCSTQREAELLYVLAKERLGRASTILTSNRPPEDWDAMFPDTVVGGAILDRLVSSATKIITTKGKSYQREVMGAENRSLGHATRELGPPRKMLFGLSSSHPQCSRKTRSHHELRPTFRPEKCPPVGKVNSFEPEIRLWVCCAFFRSTSRSSSEWITRVGTLTREG